MVETSEAKQVSRATSSQLFPEIEFGVEDNGTCPSEDFQRILARNAFDNEFANAGVKAYQLVRGEDVDVDAESRNSLARALLYHLRGLETDAVDDQFDPGCDTVLTEAARNRLFTQPVDVAIDVHNWLYYRDSDTQYVLRTDPDLPIRAVSRSNSRRMACHSATDSGCPPESVRH